MPVQNFGRKSEGNRPLGKPRRRSDNSIKMDFKEIGWGGMDWIRLAQDRESGGFL
jgi:hypothetical protein